MIHIWYQATSQKVSYVRNKLTKYFHNLTFHFVRFYCAQGIATLHFKQKIELRECFKTALNPFGKQLKSWQSISFPLMQILPLLV